MTRDSPTINDFTEGTVRIGTNQVAFLTMVKRWAKPQGDGMHIVLKQVNHDLNIASGIMSMARYRLAYLI
jgi:hypothetical protein